MRLSFLSSLGIILITYLWYAEGKTVPKRAYNFDKIHGGSHVSNISTDDNGGCSCVGSTCGCCQRITAKKIHLDHVFCANITYLKTDKGVRLTLSIDGKIFVDDRVSAKDPPALCEGIPSLLKFGSVCLRFYDMKYTKSALSGCVNLEVKVLRIKALSFHLGCFNMPIQDGKEKNIQAIKGMNLLFRPLISTDSLRRHNDTEMATEEKVEFMRKLALLSRSRHLKMSQKYHYQIQLKVTRVQ